VMLDNDPDKICEFFCTRPGYPYIAIVDSNTRFMQYNTYHLSPIPCTITRNIPGNIIEDAKRAVQLGKKVSTESDDIYDASERQRILNRVAEWLANSTSEVES